MEDIRTKEYIRNDILSNNTSTFWEMLEEHKGVNIPIYIKNIFQLNHLDNPIAFKSITDETLNELELFSRENIRDFLNPDEDLKLFFGPFYKTPGNFSFLIGDKFLIRDLVNFVQNQPENFFKNEYYEHKNLQIDQQIVKTIRIDTNRKKSAMSLALLDVNEETKHLIKMVHKIVIDVIPDVKSITAKRSLTEKVEVTVSIAEVYVNENLPISYTYNAIIKCPLCVHITKIKKCGTVENKGTRWVLSNFRRHLLTQHSNQCCSKGKPTLVIQKLKEFAYKNDEIPLNENRINTEQILNGYSSDENHLNKKLSAPLNPENFTNEPLTELSENLLPTPQPSFITWHLIRSSLDILQQEDKGEC